MSATAFEYFETLGEGVAGVVYRAKDGKGREVAVKLLREAAAKDQDLLNRFRREVDLATRLEHENLVAALEGGRTPAGRLFLSSELIRGGNAAALLEANRPLPETVALALARDVVRALGYLHAQKLVHRDVKPENVLVREDGVAKLSDFGLARSAAPGGARLTATGEVLGTPFYLAPEQIKAQKDVDVRADLYSVGCMLYEWLAGRRPYDGESVVQILAGHIRGAPPDLASVRPGLHPGTIALVQDLLRKDRAERPADPAIVEKRCGEALGALGAADGGREAVRAAVARAREAMAKGSGGPSATAAAATGGGKTMSSAAAAAGAAGVDAMSRTLSSADVRAAQGGRGRVKLKLGAASRALTLFVYGGSRLQMGRDSIDRSTNDVCLRVKGPGGDVGSRKISSVHLSLEIDPEGVAVKDLDATGGTKVDGARIKPRVPVRLRSGARIEVAGALELEVRVCDSETEGAPPAALVVTRPENGTDQAYALIRESLLVDGTGGEPRAGGYVGTLIAPAPGGEGFLLNGKPAPVGTTLKASGLTIEVAETRPEDMK